MGGLEMIRLTVGMLGTNCYVVYDAGEREGYLIDPGGDHRKILKRIDAVALSCRGVLCTHGHMDHVGAVGRIAEATGAPVMISEQDAPALEGSQLGLGRIISSLMVSRPAGVGILAPGDVLPFGVYALRVLHTPGHTRGSLSFLCDGDLFCGDLIFKGSIGRTDLKGGSLEELLDSVRREVFVLPESTRIHPGHGPATTVGEEMRANPFLHDLCGEV